MRTRALNSRSGCGSHLTLHTSNGTTLTQKAPAHVSDGSICLGTTGMQSTWNLRAVLAALLKSILPPVINACICTLPGKSTSFEVWVKPCCRLYPAEHVVKDGAWYRCSMTVFGVLTRLRCNRCLNTLDRSKPRLQSLLVGLA